MTNLFATLSASLADAQGLDQIVQAFYADGLVVIANAIPAELTADLLAEVSQRQDLQQAGVGRGGQSLMDQQIRRDKTVWLDGSSSAQQDYMALLDQLQQRVNQRCFLGLTHYECHFAHYQAGDFYQKHLDAFVGRSNRRLTTVCYLNDSLDGGHLRIYDEQDEWLADVAPQAGMLVVFESERFPHEVLPATTDRYSIAGWFRIDSPVL